jgi:hypothetical protein
MDFQLGAALTTARFDQIEHRSGERLVTERQNNQRQKTSRQKTEDWTQAEAGVHEMKAEV